MTHPEARAELLEVATRFDGRRVSSWLSLGGMLVVIAGIALAIASLSGDQISWRLWAGMLVAGAVAVAVGGSLEQRWYYSYAEALGIGQAEADEIQEEAERLDDQL